MEHSWKSPDWVVLGLPLSPDSWGTQAKKGVLEAAQGDTPKPDPTHHLAGAWTKSILIEGGDCAKAQGKKDKSGGGKRARQDGNPELGCGYVGGSGGHGAQDQELEFGPGTWFGRGEGKI